MLSIELEAHNPTRNVHRRYSICVERDLFDDWCVTIRFGRVGVYGQERRFAGYEVAPLRKIIDNCLRRRASAPERIGCSYQVVDAKVTFDMRFQEWLPSELLANIRVRAQDCDASL